MFKNTTEQPRHEPRITHNPQRGRLPVPGFFSCLGGFGQDRSPVPMKEANEIGEELWEGKFSSAPASHLRLINLGMVQRCE